MLGLHLRSYGKKRKGTKINRAFLRLARRISGLRTGGVDGVRRQTTGGHQLVEIAHFTLHFFERQAGEPTQATERGGRGRERSRVWHRLKTIREKIDRF